MAAWKNLGPVSRRWLSTIGIQDQKDLAYVGSVRAYFLIKSQYPEASLNLLWALEGALTEQSWSALSPETKTRLQAELLALEQGGRL